MKKTPIIAIIICNVVLFLTGITPAEDSLTTVLEGVLKRYGNLPGLEVAYEREIISGSMALLGDTIRTDPATGRIYFKPLRFLKIVQETPDPEIVTTDGTTLWWYIPKKSLVYKYPSKRLGKELHLLSEIFHGLRQVGESFDVMESDPGNEREHELQLFPTPPWEEIERINLTIDGDGYGIRVLEIHNLLGSITRFTLGDPVARGNFVEDFFSFKVPEGVKIIEE